MYNNDGSQPSQGGHLAGYAEVMARVDAELNAERRNIEGYNEGLDAGQAAGYRRGYNVGHTAGWNEAATAGNVEMDAQLLITQEVARQRDILQSEVDRQRHLIAALEARVDAERTEANKTIAQWKVYSEGLKTQRDDARSKLDALQVDMKQLRDTSTRIEGALKAATQACNQATVDYTTLATTHAQQLWLHERGLVFINTMYGVLSALNNDACPYAEEVRDLFAATWQDEVDQALEAGRMKASPVHDPSFVLTYPQMSSLISEMLMRAGQQYNPDDETDAS